MRILAVSADGGGCLHYRLVLPLLEMKRAGHRVHVDAGFRVVDPEADHAGFVLNRSGEIGARLEDGGHEYGFEVVIFQRWMQDRAPDIIRRARANGQVVINDLDDWWFGMPTANAAFAASHVASNASHNSDHYRKVLAASDAITVSTPYLAKRLESLGRPVYVLRNMIDLKRWEPRAVTETTDPDIGWVGALGYRSPGDLRQLAGIAAPYLSRHAGSRFVHVGAKHAVHGAKGVADDGALLAQQTGIPLDRISSRPQSTLATLPQAMQAFDIALAPIEDVPFNQGKSYVKGLEACSAGIPFIASDMPEYRLLHDGRAGILCAKPLHWARALERLSDPEERRKLAQAGRERAKDFDIAKGWRRWESAYEEIAGIKKEGSDATPTPRSA